MPHLYWSAWSTPTGGALHSVEAPRDLPMGPRVVPEPPPPTPPASPSVDGPGIPSCPSPGQPQPQQAYLGTADSSTTNSEARRTALVLPSLRTGIASAAVRRSATCAFLLLRPATGRPAAAIRVVHPSLLSLSRQLGVRCNDRHNRLHGASPKICIFDTVLASDRDSSPPGERRRGTSTRADPKTARV
jgi:hypothetical protein